MRYRDGRGDDWADIIDMLTLNPDARRQVVRVLGEIEAKGQGEKHSRFLCRQSSMLKVGRGATKCQVSSRQVFGLAIAFVAPGVVALWGISLYVPTVREWFGAAANSEATGAGFLFVLVASLAVGLFVSGVRQEVLDGIVLGRFMHLQRPETDESKLAHPDVLGALQFASENLYRYYQFYSNMALAVVVTYAAWLGHRWYWSRWRAGGLILLIAGVFALIRSAMYSRKRYFHALEDIIGQEEGASS